MTTNTDLAKAQGAMPELPENIREGAPYDDARFESLCREHGIWGTPESALCAVFWRAAIQQAAGAVPEAVVQSQREGVYESLLKQCVRQLKAWHAKYGAHGPSWIPPGGDVSLMELIDDWLNSAPDYPIPPALAASPSPLGREAGSSDHLAACAGGGVTQPLTGDELALFRLTLEGFADCGETETDYEVLVNWAQRGLLECINFQPTAAAHRMLSSITSTDQKGNAA